jgi:hypothetical protein
MCIKSKVACVVAAAAITVVCVSTASASTIGGDTIEFDYWYPDLSSLYSTVSFTVPGAEPIIYTGTATFSSDLILLNSTCTTCGSYTVSAFNGVEITDLTNPSALSDWGVDAALTTMVGFSEYISGGSIFVNWAGAAFPAQVALSTTSSATPLPAALPLFATGLGALGLLGWRRKRKNSGAPIAA